MTTKIIYHQIKKGVDCADGFAAAWVARKVYPDAEIIGCWYQCAEEDLPVVEAGDRLIIVDFSFPKTILDSWWEKGADILLIDHHKTAQEHLGFDLENLSGSVRREYIFDMSRCGAILTWQYFFPEEDVPTFLEYINDRDLWEKKLPYSEEVHTVIGKIGRSFELFDLLENSPDYDLVDVLAGIGKVLLIPKRKEIARIVLRAKETTIAGHELIPYIELEPDGSEDYLTSDICEELYTNQFPNAPFVACLTSDRTMSLRSNKNHPDGGFDVSAVAKQFGGGGHKNSAGFKINKEK